MMIGDSLKDDVSIHLLSWYLYQPVRVTIILKTVICCLEYVQAIKID